MFDNFIGWDSNLFKHPRELEQFYWRCYQNLVHQNRAYILQLKKKKKSLNSEKLRENKPIILKIFHLFCLINYLQKIELWHVQIVAFFNWAFHILNGLQLFIFLMGFAFHILSGLFCLYEKWVHAVWKLVSHLLHWWQPIDGGRWATNCSIDGHLTILYNHFFIVDGRGRLTLSWWRTSMWTIFLFRSSDPRPLSSLESYRPRFG